MRPTRTLQRTPALLATLALLAGCGDAARLPTDPSSGDAPRLIAGETLVVTAGPVTTTPTGCALLAPTEWVRIGAETWVCIPIAAHADGIAGIEVRGIQSQWDEDTGAYAWVDVFSQHTDESVQAEPLQEAMILVPRLSPTNRQAAGSFRIEVTLTTGEDRSATFSVAAALTAVPSVEITGPAADTVFVGGSTALATTQVTNADGVRLVRAHWSGAAEHVETIMLPTLPTDTALSHTLPLPAANEGGELVLRVTAEDEKGVVSDTARRTFQVESGRDTIAPVIRERRLVGPRLATGDTLAFEAIDRSGVARIGWVLMDEAKSTILHGDSLDFDTPEDTTTAEFEVAIPAGFDYGPAVVVAFAEDTAGNRGWMAPGEEPAPGVADLDEAHGFSVVVTIGRLVPHPEAWSWSGVEVSAFRQEAYFASPETNTVEVLRLWNGTFADSMAVGSRPTGLEFLSGSDGTPTSRLLVANSGGDEVSLIDVDQAETTTTFVLPAARINREFYDQGGEKTDSIEYRMTPRPTRLAAACLTPSCVSYTVYATSRTTATEPFSAVRVFRMPSPTTMDTDAMDLVAPTVDHASTVTGDTTETVETTASRVLPDGDLSTIWTRTTVAGGATIHTGAGPFLATSPVTGWTYIAQGADTEILGTGSRIIRIRPEGGIDYAKVALASDYTLVPGDDILGLDVSDEGGLVAFTTNDHVVVTDRNLAPKAAILNSGSGPERPEFVAFLKQSGGGDSDHLAVARTTGDWIDVYELDNYTRIGSLPVKERVRGDLAFVRVGGDAVVLVARTRNGVLVIQTTIAEISALAD